MDLILYMFLGILQGITEWLPVSSTAQEIIAMRFLGINIESAFSLAIYLHLGTLLAVIVRFRNDIVSILKSISKFKEDRLTLFLIVSTIFTGIIGLPVYKFLRDIFEGGFYGNLVTMLIGLFLIITGIILYLSKNKSGVKKVNDSGIDDMILLGIAQGFTILPGISRSGITIATLLFRNFEQEDALRISFLMSIPAVIGANILYIANGNFGNLDLTLILIGILAAFIIGYLTIDILMKFARNIRFDIFCITIGLLAAIFGLINYL